MSASLVTFLGIVSVFSLVISLGFFLGSGRFGVALHHRWAMHCFLLLPHPLLFQQVVGGGQ